MKNEERKFTKTKLVILTLISAFSLQPSALLAQGSLTPPGAPAPTMKTLTQVEPRTPIAAAPFTISTPGAYYLTTNLTVTLGNAITIAASGVTLDLSGFTIASTDANDTGNGILLNNGLSDIAIVNGHINGGVTNNGSGVYSGPGFANGIAYPNTAPVNTRVANISISGCRYYGIFLNSGDSTVVESCTVRTVGSYGICASTIKSSVAADCGGNAISGIQVLDSQGGSTGSGYGIYANITAQNCFGASSGGYGIYTGATAQNCSGSSLISYGLYANYNALNCSGTSSSGTGLYAGGTAENCYSASTSGTGLNADTAQNCYGYSSTSAGLVAGTIAQNCHGSSNGNGNGLYAYYNAQNCYGTSGGSGYGLYAHYKALNCYGSSSSGYGLFAYNALSCTGISNSGIGLWAWYIAQNCIGTSSSSTGLSTDLANSCYGYSTSGPALTAGYKCNMP